MSATIRRITNAMSASGMNAATRQPPCHFQTLRNGQAIAAIRSATTSSMKPLNSATSPAGTGSLARC